MRQQIGAEVDDLRRRGEAGALGDDRLRSEPGGERGPWQDGEKGSDEVPAAGRGMEARGMGVAGLQVIPR